MLASNVLTYNTSLLTLAYYILAYHYTGVSESVPIDAPCDSMTSASDPVRISIIMSQLVDWFSLIKNGILHWAPYSLQSVTDKAVEDAITFMH